LRLSTTFATALLASAAALAAPRPVTVEAVATLATPDAAFVEFGAAVGVDGDHALVSAARVDDSGEKYFTAFLYRREGARWVPVRQLPERLDWSDFRIPAAIAMRDGIAVVQGGSATDVYQLDGGEWLPAAAQLEKDGPGPSLRIDRARVVSGEGTCAKNGRVYANDGGTWRSVTLLQGYRQSGGCDNDLRGGPVDIAGDWALVHQPRPDPDDQARPTALLFRDYGDGAGFDPRAYGGTESPADAAQFGESVALLPRGGDAAQLPDVIVSGGNASGSYVYRETDSTGLRLATRIETVDGLMGGNRARGMVAHGGLLFQASPSHDRAANVVNVFRPRDDGTYQHVAILAARNGASLGAAIAVSGTRVLVGDGGDGLVHAFDLPTPTMRTPLQENFASTNIARWTQTPGSSFAVAVRGATRVLRQTGAGSGLRAILAESDFTSQAVEADIRPSYYYAADSGAGVATRYQSESNYFEAILRNSGRVELRRRASGTLRVLASAPFVADAERWYRLRLESVGTLHRVLVDGVVRLEVDAGGPTHGHAALVTDRTSAEFDNVIVSPSLTSTIYSSGFEDRQTASWKRSGLGYWNLWNGASTVWNQSSIAGYARASIGVPTDDQVVRVRARLDTFASANGAEERWFGVMARHTDANNFYYLSIRSPGTVSLRKFVNGVSTTLGTGSQRVQPAVWYALRLDAVGDQIRAFVDGRLVVEATDTSLPRGNGGPVMFKAAVDYDDYDAQQP
jgi:hypothetical protein